MGMAMGLGVGRPGGAPGAPSMGMMGMPPPPPPSLQQQQQYQLQQVASQTLTPTSSLHPKLYPQNLSSP